MKATGIVRRIDDLGRVVIPKELRRTMRLREGAPLEIFTDKDGELIFKKYSPIGELSDFAADLCESLRAVSDAAAAVCDRDGVIAASGAPTLWSSGRPVRISTATVFPPAAGVNSMISNLRSDLPEFQPDKFFRSAKGEYHEPQSPLFLLPNRRVPMLKFFFCVLIQPTGLFDP